MLLVVMLEGNGQVTQRRFSIRLGYVRHVITLDRLHEALCHAITLRATHRCGHRLQADLSTKQPRLFGGLGRTVIAEPLHRRCGQLITEALLHAFQHQVANIIAAVPGWAGTQPMASRSQQSRAKVTLSLAPSSQDEKRGRIYF